MTGFSTLPVASSFTGAEALAGSQGGVGKRFLLSDLATYIAAAGVAGVASFNTRTGVVSLLSADVTTALGFTPISGNQTITLTGDGSGSGTTSISFTIGANAVSFAKFVAAASAGFVGATGAGNYSHRTPTQVTAALDVLVGDSGSGGTKGLVPAPAAGDAAAGKFLKASGSWAVPSASVADADYGDISVSSGVWTIDNGVVGLAKLANMATASVYYRKTAGSGAPEVQTLATLKTDLGLTGTNSGDQTSIVGISGTIAQFNAACSDADFVPTGLATASGLTTSATDKLLGRSSASGGAVEEITCTAAGRALIDDADAAAQRTTLGLAAIAASGSGADLTSASVTLGKVATQATATILGNNTGSTASPVALTAAQVKTLLAIAAADVTAGGSSGNLQYNGGSTISGAANLNVNASGNLVTAYASASTTPGADNLEFAPQRLLANGGRVMPRWKDESGVFNTMQPHLGRNNVCGLFLSGGTAFTQVGINLTASGTATARAPATTNRLTRTKRTAFVSAATAGAVGGLTSQTISNFTLGSGTVLGGGGFFAVFRWAASDAATVAGAHMFVGMQSGTGAPSATTNPNTFTNCVGVAQLNGGANLNIVYGGSAAQTSIDLGASFPAGCSSATNGGLYELILYAPPGSNNIVYYRVERIDTGDVASGTLTGTAGTALPANSTFLGPRMFRANNATALAVAIDIAGFTVETDF